MGRFQQDWFYTGKDDPSQEVRPLTRHREDVQVPHPTDVLQPEVTDLRAPPAPGVSWWCQVVGEEVGVRCWSQASGHLSNESPEEE